MAGVNKVIIIGNLGRDPESRSFQNGGKICSLRVATSESWRDKQTGERKERTEWHSVTLQAEHAISFAEQYLRKGSTVYIEGKLQTRKWQDQSGADRYSTEIVVGQFGGVLQAVGPRQDSDGGQQGGGYDNGARGGQQQGSGYGSGGRPGAGYGGGAGGDMDDEIPFAPEWRI